MTQANLSETLFKPRFKHPETSTLVRRFNHGAQPPMQSALDGRAVPHWYRMISHLMWIWRGIDLREILGVQTRIAMSDAERTNDDLYDTVIGYYGGNWIYEWATQTMVWQQKACAEEGPQPSGRHWPHATTLYDVAACPHLKGDDLAEQAQALSNRAYEEAVQHLPGTVRQMEFTVPGGTPITGFLYMPKGNGPFPTVLTCGGLDAVQTNYYSLYKHYFAPCDTAILTIDMPSVGFSSKWKLTQDSSLLHQHVLETLPNIPWVDHARVVALSFRFSANVTVRLAYLESLYLKVAACLGPIVHTLLSDFKCQRQVPGMYPDVLASRLGMHDASDKALRAESNRYSLKVQRLLERRYPTPVLSDYWKNDPFSPEEDSHLITSSSADGKLLEIPFNPVHRNFDEGLRKITDWIEKRLC